MDSLDFVFEKSWVREKWQDSITFISITSEELYNFRYIDADGEDWKPYAISAHERTVFDEPQKRNIFSILKNHFPQLLFVDTRGVSLLQKTAWNLKHLVVDDLKLSQLLMDASNTKIEDLANAQFDTVLKPGQFPHDRSDIDAEISDNKTAIENGYGENNAPRHELMPQGLYAGISITWIFPCRRAYSQLTCDEFRQAAYMLDLLGARLYLKFRTDRSGTRIMRKWFAEEEEGPEGPSIDRVLGMLQRHD